MSKRIKITALLIILNAALLAVTGFMVRDYMRFQQGEIVEGVVTDTRHYGRGADRRDYVEIQAQIDDAMYSQEVRVATRKLSVNGTTSYAPGYEQGETLNIATAKTTDGYDLAIAEDALSLWPELLWALLSLLLVMTTTVVFIRSK